MTFDRARFRAELILHLPDGGLTIDRRPDADGDRVAHFDHDYDRDALAAWILSQVDAAAETPDDQLGRIVEVAGAASTVKAFAEFGDYLIALASVLRRGHTLASQTDLARTIETEAAKLRRIAADLVANYPQLVRVETPDRGLVVPGQNG